MIRLGLALLAGLVWWRRSAPRPEIEIAGPLHIDESTAAAVAAVDHSADFARDLERFPSDLPGIDDLVFVDAGATALVTATDRRIWTVDTRTHTAEPFAELPSMAYGLHEAPDDPDRVYLCVAGSYGGLDGPGTVAPGLYRLTRHDG